MRPKVSLHFSSIYVTSQDLLTDVQLGKKILMEDKHILVSSFILGWNGGLLVKALDEPYIKFRPEVRGLRIRLNLMQLSQLVGSPWFGWVLPLGFSFGFLFRYFRLKFGIGSRFRFGQVSAQVFGPHIRINFETKDLHLPRTWNYNGSAVDSTSFFSAKSPAQLRSKKPIFHVKFHWIAAIQTTGIQ